MFPVHPVLSGRPGSVITHRAVLHFSALLLLPGATRRAMVIHVQGVCSTLPTLPTAYNCVLSVGKYGTR